MPSIFCPPRYDGHFLTLQYISPIFGVKIIEWEYGKPKDHAWLPTMFEAVGWALGQGLTLATPVMQSVFERDVINGDEN